MLLAYLDESKTQRSFFVGALIVPDVEAKGLAAALQAVVENAQDRYGRIHADAELHGNALAGAKEAWASFKGKVQASVDVYQEAAEAIARHDVRIYIRGIELASVTRNYGAGRDPHSIVLPWVLERVQEHALAEHDVALAIADEVAQRERFRHDLRRYQEWGTGGWRSQQLTEIVDTIHFAPSKASRLLQASDLVLYAYTQHVRRHRDPRAEAAWKRIWDTFDPRVRETSRWER